VAKQTQRKRGEKTKSGAAPERSGADDRHEQARARAEEALEKYAHGDKNTGDKLAEEAVQMDRSAVEEVVAELDEDAGSDHSVGEKEK
jgi:Tfp pilus assembly protein PilF